MRPHVRVLGPVGVLALAISCIDGSITTPATNQPVPRPAVASSPEPTVVEPGAKSGWVMQGMGASDARLAAALDVGARGGAASRGHTGGIRLRVGTGQADGALVRTERFAGMPLSDVTALRFSTYVTQRGSEEDSPFLTLAIDLDGDGYVDDQLWFRPTPVLSTWETWDALQGGWWSNSDIGSPDARGIRTLAAYRAAAPNARLASALTIGAWDVNGSRPLVADVDDVVIGVGSTLTLFRFGPAAPAPR